MIKGSKITMTPKEKEHHNTTKTWDFNKGFDEFIQYCQIKNLRDKTIKNYVYQFNLFKEYLSNHSTHEYINELTQLDIDNYTLYLKNLGIRDTSINSYLRGLRAVIYFWHENNQCDRLKVKIPKADKKIKETYSDQELFKLLQKPNIHLCEFTTYRNWCIINFLLATGVRVSTLINIKIEDLDLTFNRINLIYTKNRKSYVIPISAQLKEILIEYLSFRQGEPKDYLFCNLYGDALTPDALKHAITKYNHSRGVEKSGLHSFRHTFAKKCVMNGVNVFVLQRLLGHSDISVTKEYVDLYADDLAVNIENYNPLDTLGKTKPIVQKKKITRKRITM